MSDSEKPSAKNWHDLVVDPKGRICLRGGAKTWVDVIEVANGRRLACHKTILNCGGQRLAISDDTRHFIAGSWGHPDGGGVACYETNTGHLVWHSRNLKSPQLLSYEPTSDSWLISLDKGGTFFINRMTGKIKFQLRGSFRNLLGFTKDECLIDARSTIERVDPRSGVVVGKLKVPRMFEWVAGKTKWGTEDRVMAASRTNDLYSNTERKRLSILDGDAANDCLVVAHVGGALQCFSLLSGKMVWETLPPLYSNFLTVGIATSTKHVWAVCRNLQHGSPVELWCLALRDGSIHSKNTWPDSMGRSGVFCNGGSYFVDGMGVIDLPDRRMRFFD